MIAEPRLVTALVAPANPVLRAGVALAVGFALLVLMFTVPLVRGLLWLRWLAPFPDRDRRQGVVVVGPCASCRFRPSNTTIDARRIGHLRNVQRRARAHRAAPLR
jgi:hypothetical protein